MPKPYWNRRSTDADLRTPSVPWRIRDAFIAVALTLAMLFVFAIGPALDAHDDSAESQRLAQEERARLHRAATLPPIAAQALAEQQAEAAEVELQRLRAARSGQAGRSDPR